MGSRNLQAPETLAFCLRYSAKVLSARFSNEIDFCSRAILMASFHAAIRTAEQQSLSLTKRRGQTPQPPAPKISLGRLLLRIRRSQDVESPGCHQLKSLGSLVSKKSKQPF